MKGFYRLLRLALEEAGCTLVRYGKGDHQIWYSPITKTNFVVDGGVISRHSANGMLKQPACPSASD